MDSYKMLQAEQILQNRYQLIQPLSDDAARQTWLATDLQTSGAESSHVVLKLLAFGGQVRWESLKLFEREAQVLQQLHHPRIPKYRDHFCLDEQLLWFGLVEEYIPGSSLKDLLNQGQKFTELEARKIAEDVLGILIYLHQLIPPVLHRDIKPSNLIRGNEEQIYLVDFGAVQDKAAKEGATFTVVGTYGYAPMEQFGGRAVPSSDLYALGATLIHLLTGTAPADLPQRDLRIHFSDRIGASPSLVRWIERLTEPSLERRFSSASQALEALHTGYSLVNVPSHDISQPTGSRVQLKKSAGVLEIKIPAQGLRGILSSDTFIALFWSTFFFVLSSSRLHSVGSYSSYWWLFWVLGLIGLGSLPLTLFGQSSVYLNREYFEIEWKLFGLPYWRRRGRISNIHHVCNHKVSVLFQKKPTYGVAFQVGTQIYTFGAFAPPLAEVERLWLIREIKDWLNIE